MAARRQKPHDLRDKNTFAYRLAQRRKELGINTTELDMRSGRSPGTCRVIEWRNSRMVHVETAMALAKALKVNYIWLLTGDGERLMY